MFKKFLCLLLALSLVFCAVPVTGAEAETITVLFTHDLHSHVVPAAGADGVEYGGYARLMTAIQSEKAKNPDAVLVDAGDFSMGTLFHSIFSTDAAELRLMGAMGYDATTFGNHEYDFRPAGLAQMLETAANSGDPLPAIVQANYLPPKAGDANHSADTDAVAKALDAYGAREYIILERGGVKFGIFGLMGQESHEMAPMSSMTLLDPIETAKDVVSRIEAEAGPDCLIICLSHSGTKADPKESEDELLAKAVPDIDVIVSGHTHTTLTEPIRVGSTTIVSGGEYSKNLGVLELTPTADGAFAPADYRLVAIDAGLSEDAALAEKIEIFKTKVAQNYLSRFGDLTFDGVLAQNPWPLDTTDDLDEHRESGYGNLLADAFLWAVTEAEGENGTPVDFALTANGLIREGLPTGDITVEQAFNALSLGSGADGVAGYPLVSVYLTGKDLKNAFEVDASVTSIMPEAQLYFSGMRFTYNPGRMIFDKVTDCAQILPDGTEKPIDDDKLYRVVAGLYCGQMLGSVNDKSFGILSVTPRDKDGNIVENLDDCIIHKADGTELKEWAALAEYLQHLGTVPADYAVAQGRKVAETGGFFALIKNPGMTTLVVMILPPVLIGGIGCIVWGLVRRRKKKKQAVKA